MQQRLHRLHHPFAVFSLVVAFDLVIEDIILMALLSVGTSSRSCHYPLRRVAYSASCQFHHHYYDENSSTWQPNHHFRDFYYPTNTGLSRLQSKINHQRQITTWQSPLVANHKESFMLACPPPGNDMSAYRKNSSSLMAYPTSNKASWNHGIVNTRRSKNSSNSTLLTDSDKMKSGVKLPVIKDKLAGRVINDCNHLHCELGLNNWISKGYHRNKLPQSKDPSYVYHGSPMLQVNNIEQCCKEQSIVNSKSEKKLKDDTKTLPSTAQLEVIRERLSFELPDFFTAKQSYSIYSDNIVFENKLLNIKVRGLTSYKMMVATMKGMCRAYCCNLVFDVLKITKHHDDGTIRIRWRVTGLPRHQVALLIWPFIQSPKCRYFECFSVLRVGINGVINHHRLDKVTPSDYPETTQRNLWLPV
ncbi:uncharacterized protein TRIADDRAFT_53431 [Trichoplax adhaerens]|uniref:Uncharacterized protein n=1 Tax=Trichoplax adhaerens TaxID=10228 RepID=B3RP76_TRIAD|nr:hypothetical protein TRIADDRAFT_53431 [Trichoplax adhaerens]EDV27586.1 hypothetical protein TRIADDRAFT_53431 [Trichoplax adhaerens]|eukprot:XP_002109420.1 hypothetical protein TRIADDRAFT_53431 [Trichoplax adhaerens]